MNFLKKYDNFLMETIKIHKDDYKKAADLMAKIISQNKNVREFPKGSDKGPEISKWLKSLNVSPGNPWAMAFVYGIFDKLCRSLGVENQLPKTASVMAHWEKTDSKLKLSIQDARNKPDLLKPGMIFIMVSTEKDKKKLGHTGIITSVDPIKKTFTSIEGNIHDMGSNESDRVGINLRNLNDPILIGFTDYFHDIRC